MPPAESAPDYERYWAPLPPPPGTPEVDASDAKALEAHLFQPVIVRCILMGTKASDMVGLKDTTGQTLKQQEPAVKGSTLRLLPATPAVDKYFGINPEARVDEAAASEPKTVYIAGVLDLLHLHYTGWETVRMTLRIHAVEQISPERADVRFPWQTRPSLAGAEWMHARHWSPLPAKMAFGGPGPGLPVKLKVLQMHSSATAGAVTTVAGVSPVFYTFAVLYALLGVVVVALLRGLMDSPVEGATSPQVG